MPEDFESQLRQALIREAAPPDFAARVMAQVNARKIVAFPWWRKRSSMVVAAGLLAGAVIPVTLVEHRRHERAIEAKRQLVAALQITRARLNFAKEKMHVKDKMQRKHS